MVPAQGRTSILPLGGGGMSEVFALQHWTLTCETSFCDMAIEFKSYHCGSNVKHNILFAYCNHPENGFSDLPIHRDSTNSKPSNFFDLEGCRRN